MSVPRPDLDHLPMELYVDVYKRVFQSHEYDVDLTRLSCRKTPDWVNTLTLWQLYWATVRLHVPGETWYRVDRTRLIAGGVYLQPWRRSLERVLKFSHRLFCYPEQEPENPMAGREESPHPARLRDVMPPKSIEFEVLCHFDHRGIIGHANRSIFRSKEEIINIRAMLWLFKVLKCHRPENRHRLNIVLKWKDIRYTKPKVEALECYGASENIYTYQEDPDHPTKAEIPDGLGIKERYMQVIEEGLTMWSGYCLERETRESLTEAQKSETMRSLYWAPCPHDAPSTFKIGMWCARHLIHSRNFANQLAINICKNLRTKVFDHNNRVQLAHLEFWQRVGLNTAPPLPGDEYWQSITPEFLAYLNSHVKYSGPAIWDFSTGPRLFVKTHKVEPQGQHLFGSPLACDWNVYDFVDLGREARRPWNDDTESDGS